MAIIAKMERVDTIHVYCGIPDFVVELSASKFRSMADEKAKSEACSTFRSVSWGDSVVEVDLWFSNFACVTFAKAVERTAVVTSGPSCLAEIG